MKNNNTKQAIFTFTELGANLDSNHIIFTVEKLVNDFMDRFDLQTLDVPEGSYAVFQTPHTKHPVDDYVKLRENIAGEWLPGSGYTLRNAPELAIYHWYTMPDHQEKRYIEIWIPVEA